MADQTPESESRRHLAGHRPLSDPDRFDGFLAHLFEEAPIAMMVHDVKGITYKANREARRLFGGEGNELLGRRARDLHVDSASEKQTVDELSLHDANIAGGQA